jgi:transposase
MTRTYARSLVGQRAYATAPVQKGKNVTIIGAVALRGIVAFINIFGASNSLTFEAFIVRCLLPNLWEGACVIMDNASIHKEEELRPLIESVGARLEFLPPYSPDFSPIENCWSKVKSILREMEPRTYRDLVDAIQEAFKKITSRDIHSFFTHCCYCTSDFVEQS